MRYIKKFLTWLNGGDWDSHVEPVEVRYSTLDRMDGLR